MWELTVALDTETKLYSLRCYTFHHVMNLYDENSLESRENNYTKQYNTIYLMLLCEYCNIVH